MTRSLRTYSTEELSEWVKKLDALGDDISRGSADRIKLLMEREADLLSQLRNKKSV